MMALLYVSLYSTWACQSGTLLARVPVVNTPGACVVSEAIEGPLATAKLTLRVPDTWAQVDDLTVGRVIRLTYIDNSTAAGAFDEFRIHEVQRSTGGDNTLSITALGPLYEFGLKRLLLTEQISGSPSTVLAAILAAGPSIFAAGTVTPTTVTDHAFEGVMPIAALQQLGEAVNALADVDAGEHFAFQARRNGVANYLLDYINVGSTATVPDVRTGKNLRSLITRTSLREAPTRLYLTAQGQPVYDAWFEIESVDTGYVILTGIGGDTSLNPIAADDALAVDCEGNALTTHLIDEVGNAYEVTGTTRATRRIDLTDETGLTAGQWVRFARNSAGDPLDRLDLPNTEAVVGLLDVPWPAATNWLANPRFADWSGTDPDDWTSSNDDFVQSTTGTLFGTAASLPATETGSLTPSTGWTASNRSRAFRRGETVTYRMWLTVPTWFMGGPVTLDRWEVRNPAAGANVGVEIVPNVPPYGEPEFHIPPGESTPPTDAHFEVTRQYQVLVDGTENLHLTFIKSQPDSAYLIDGFAVYVTPAGLTPPAGFVEGSSGARALVRGVNYLLSRQSSPSVYDVNLLDLTAHDGTTWPYDTLTLGGSLRLTSDLSGTSDTLRVMQLDRDLLFPLAGSRVVLSARWQTLTSQLFGALVKPTRVTIGTPVNLDPTEPPPPPPPPAANTPPYVLVHGAAGVPNARILRAAGGVTLEDEGPGANLTIVGGVTEYIELSMDADANLFASGVTLKTWDPVPFDEIDHQIGDGLTLEASGAVTAAAAGLYGYEFQARFVGQISGTPPAYLVGVVYVYDDPWDNPDMSDERLYWHSGMPTGSSAWAWHTMHISGVLRVDAGDAITFGIISRRDTSGDHLVGTVLGKVWRIGDLP